MNRVEYGDFQTPLALADSVVSFLSHAGCCPSTVIEPTCGTGSFFKAAIEGFSTVQHAFAFDINPDYISLLTGSLSKRDLLTLRVAEQDFFTFDWEAFIASLEAPILVIGNPPWITNAALGALGSKNLPEKSNINKHSGLDAKTGKANFDIAEWMIIMLLRALSRKRGSLAMLCKTATARKVLRHAWLNGGLAGKPSVHLIDAKKYFGVSVDACLLYVQGSSQRTADKASVYSDLSRKNKMYAFGVIGRELVANIDLYQKAKSIDGSSYYTWRSGVKHDASSIMELRKSADGYMNGLGEEWQLEDECLFPLLKSSDIANKRLIPNRYVLLTQCRPSDETKDIGEKAPFTWSYLTHHAEVLDKRKSIIYSKRPRFSVFGIGDYTFAPWKVAVSGLYKNMSFNVIGQHAGRPIVLDDTCYFVACKSEREAKFICNLLNSERAMQFLQSLVFIDAKRPLTVEVLSRLDLKRIAESMNAGGEAERYLADAEYYENRQRLMVFEKKGIYPPGSTLKPRLAVRASNANRILKGKRGIPGHTPTSSKKSFPA